MKLTIDYVAKCCAEACGPEAVRVKTAHHFQVRNGKGWHNVYVSKSGNIKIHREGCKGSQILRGVDALLDIVTKPQPQSDVHKARAAVDLATFVGFAKRNLGGLQVAVFVDAGWKEGIAQIAVVKVERWESGIAVEAGSFPMAMDGSQAAERFAIEWGIKIAGPGVTVFSDCLDVANEFRSGQVKWLERSSNRVADRLGNRRKEFKYQ